MRCLPLLSMRRYMRRAPGAETLLDGSRLQSQQADLWPDAPSISFYCFSNSFAYTPLFSSLAGVNAWSVLFLASLLFMDLRFSYIDTVCKLFHSQAVVGKVFKSLTKGQAAVADV